MCILGSLSMVKPLFMEESTNTILYIFCILFFTIKKCVSISDKYINIYKNIKVYYL